VTVPLTDNGLASGDLTGLVETVERLHTDQRPVHRLVFECDPGGFGPPDSPSLIGNGRRLGRTGAGIVLDRYGGGWSAARWLRSLPIIHLRLDPELLATAASDSSALLVAAVEQAHAAGCGLIAPPIDLARRHLARLAIDRQEAPTGPDHNEHHHR
jgi:EAL domain-containing protein (putative c-di-GMP-specific phosphodiesterase class I)